MSRTEYGTNNETILTTLTDNFTDRFKISFSQRAFFSTLFLQFKIIIYFC
jgi:hypothetical protein